MPISSASAKSVSESPPRTASAREDEHRAEAGVHRARHGLQDRGVRDLGERPSFALRPPQLADPVEDDDRVVDRVADDGEQRGQEHPVDRLAQPGEDADQRRARRAPSRAPPRRRTSSGTGSPGRPAARRARPRARSAPCAAARRRGSGRSARRAPCSTLAADARPRAARISASCVVGQLAGAHRDVVLAAAPARRRAGSRRRRPPRGRRRRRPAACVEYSTSRPPVNSTPRSSPRIDDAGHGQDAATTDEPASQRRRVPHQVRVARVQPGADPAERRDAGDGRARRSRRGGATAHSASTRVMTSAETIEASTPMASVTPKPCTGPDARKNSSPAASRVVTLESTIALQRLAEAGGHRGAQALAGGRRRTPPGPVRRPARSRRSPCRWRARSRPGRAGSGWRRGRPAPRRRSARSWPARPRPGRRPAGRRR